MLNLGLILVSPDTPWGVKRRGGNILSRAAKCPGSSPRQIDEHSSKQAAVYGYYAKLLEEDIHYVLEDGIWLEAGVGVRRKSVSSVSLFAAILMSRESGRLRQHSKRVEKEIENWQRSSRDMLLPSSMSTSSSMSRLRQPRKHRKSLPAEFMSDKTRGSPVTSAPLGEQSNPNMVDNGFDFIWSLVHQIPGTHLSQGQTTSLWSPTPVSDLE